MTAPVLLRSSIGKKIIMAITGLIWVGYLLMHMYGNLKVFGGAEAFNHYAESLRTLGAPLLGHGHALLVARAGLLIAIILHVWCAVALKRMAARARPQRYDTYRIMNANYAMVTMRWGGAAIAAFLLYHVAHLTWGVPGLNAQFVHGAPFQNLVAGFQNPVHVILYLIALVMIGLHLYHGTASFWQTMGWRTAKHDSLIRGFALILALGVPLGFATVPLSVLVGLVP